MNDLPDVGPGDLVFVGQGLHSDAAGRIPSAHVSALVFGELSSGGTWHSQALLASGVLHVRALRAEEQVRRIDARWNVAGVENGLAPWNRPVGEFPRHAVCAA